MKHPFRWLSAGVILSTALGTGVAVTQSSCGQTPVNVPVRTFERAGRMDVLCMQILSTDPNAIAANGGVPPPIPAVPVALNQCSPVATGTTTPLTYHLVAVVTQTLRGELAVVDLTGGHVVDVSRSLPGVNFLPVGQNPTDVVVTPDATRVFVAAAETNKPAIYEIPSSRLLGDSQTLAEPTQAAEQTALPSWPACGLPQAPGRMVVVPTGAVAADGGEGGVAQGYEIVVVMPGNGVDIPALAGVIDTAAFDTLTPGSLAPCPIKSIIHLDENPSALPKSWTPGPNWPLGLPYVDGGIDLFTTTAEAGTVQPSTNYELPLWSCPSLAHAPGADAGAPDASPVSVASYGQAHAQGIATDGRFVWIADQSRPFIHVLDTTQSSAPLVEIAPLVATSITDPTRIVTTSELAVSPVTRDYKRYLYAVDATLGNGVMVYDVTDPANGPRLPLTRPNSELNPQQAPDRILFNSPIATLTLARHDFPIPGPSGPAETGLLCNPNPNAGTQGNGVEYGANGPLSVPLGPKRLRGVFAFATLTNGQVVAVDVDDWDSPCRRPLDLSVNFATGSLAVAEPNLNDIDPYHAPTASALATDGGLMTVTDESMWPVIQPNRIRSFNEVKDDLTGSNGLHDPSLVSAPLLLVNGAPVATGNSNFAVLTAAKPNFTAISPSPTATAPNVFMAHEVPEVHVDQTWNIVYEGMLPGFNGVTATIESTDFTTLTLSSGSALFCGHGVEDHRVGLQRYAAMKVDDAQLSSANGVSTMISASFDQRVGDYVQIADDILGAPNFIDAGITTPTDDPYWHLPEACWTGLTTTTGEPLDNDPNDAALAARRQQTCFDKFGAYGADQSTQRDFPILEAYEDHLVVGRYLYLDPNNRPSNGRIIAPKDTSAQVDFKLAQCCFHNKAHFNIRTGSEWVALGTATPYLHHIVPDPSANNACVQSCDSRQVLMNARAPELAIPSVPNATFVVKVPPTRNSPFAMRSPIMSFYVAAPVVSGNDAKSFFVNTVRDYTWQLQTRGGYAAQGISLTGATTAVVPQSSMWIPPLGAIAVVDGSAEGLFIIDLNTLQIAGGSPFF